MTGWFSLLFYLARCTENELRRQVELLKAENEMLRTRVPKKRTFLKREKGELLLKLGAAIGPGASKLITIVHRRTYQHWVREKTSGKKPGKRIWTPTGLRQAFVLAFIHLGTRRVICSPCSFKPDAKWMVCQAHVFVERTREAELRIEYLVRDRNGIYVRELDQVFKDIGCPLCANIPETDSTPSAQSKRFY